jgi:hypothetical protein
MSRAKKIIESFTTDEKVSLDHLDKMYIKGIITTILDALKIKGIDYKLKKRLEDAYSFLSKALILNNDRPAYSDPKEN